eukprot:jgi/Astpho2/6672/Aster-05029
MQGPEAPSATFIVMAVALSVVSAIVGLLLPRPRWLVHWKAGHPLWYASPTGSYLRKLALALNGAMVVRLAAQAWTDFTGHKVHIESAEKSSSLEDAQTVPAGCGSNQDIDWYVAEADLQFFQEHMEEEVPVPGASSWVKMCCMELGHLTYTAYRRRLPHGRTEYKSVTIADDSTAQEFMDFYLNDPTRQQWDTMITECGIVESGPAEQRCQVVRWLRTFPFSFINQREYILARRLWRRDGCLYSITKAVDHPRAPEQPGIVRMDSAYSMWRSRTIPDPKQPGRPACETVLLHYENFKIPENLARFAVKHGMSGFVKKMSAAVPEFVANRRLRVDKFSEDPDAHGMKEPANPPPLRTSSGLSSMDSYTSEDSTSCSEADGSPSAQGGECHGG